MTKICLLIIATVATSCKKRSKSDLAGGPSCGPCCQIDPEMKEREGTPTSVREAARMRVFLMKQAFEQQNPMAMLILAKLMRTKLTGEQLTLEQFFDKINIESGGSFYNKDAPAGATFDQKINEESSLKIAREFLEKFFESGSPVPGDRKLVVNAAHLQEVISDGLSKVSDANGRELLVGDISEAMRSYFEASGTQAFGQKSTLKPSQALVMTDILVDSVIASKMDYITVENGVVRSKMPFQTAIDFEVGKSFADAIYSKIGRMASLQSVSSQEITAARAMVETFREAVRDKSQLKDIDVALEILSRADKAQIEALRAGKITVDGKAVEISFEDGFNRDKLLEMVREKGLEGRVRSAFREADRAVRR